MGSCPTEDFSNVPFVPLCGLARFVAVPDLRSRAFLAALHACAARNGLWISSRRFGDVAAFVFRDFSK